MYVVNLTKCFFASPLTLNWEFTQNIFNSKFEKIIINYIFHKMLINYYKNWQNDQTDKMLNF